LRSAITYFTGGIKYSIPNDLIFSYALVVLRFIFIGFLVSYYFATPYTVLTFAITILLADFRFFIDFHDYIDFISEDSEED